MKNSKSKSVVIAVLAVVLVVLVVVGVVVAMILFKKDDEDERRRADKREETTSSVEPDIQLEPITQIETLTALTADSSLQSTTRNEIDNVTQPQSKTSSYSMSDEDVRLMNVFLSNFSEAFVENINTSDSKRIIEFAILNIQLNHYKLVENLDEETATELNEKSGNFYDRYIMAEDVQNTIKRFFNINVENKSVESALYMDGKYYLIAAYGETYAHFSRISKVTDNGDGTLTVNYDVFWDINCYGSIPAKDLYYGWSTSKTDTERYSYSYSGVGILKKDSSVGSGYAPYRVISLKKS